MSPEVFHKWLPYKGKMENPIVLIHGYLESHTMWYQLPLSDLERPILLVDVPGFGKSNLLDDNLPSIRYFADSILKLIQQYELTEYTVIGHSMGGYIGLEMMQNNPALKHLILLNSNFWADSEQKKTDRTRVADILLKVKNRFIAEAIPNLFAFPEQHQAQINALVNEAQQGIAEWYAYASLAMRERIDYTEFVHVNSNKISIVHGENDGLISTELLIEKTKNTAPIHLIPHAGHMAVFEEPEKVMEVLKRVV